MSHKLQSSQNNTHTLSIPLIYTLTHPHSIFPTIRLTLYHSYTTPFTHTWTQSSWHFDFPWHVNLRRRGAPQRIQNLTLGQSFTLFDTHSDIVIFYMNDKIRSILNDHLVTAFPIHKIMYKTFKMEISHWLIICLYDIVCAINYQSHSLQNIEMNIL